MTRGRISSVLAAAAAVVAAVALVRWRSAATPEFPSHRFALARDAAPRAFGDSVLDDAEDATVSNDPFRLANEPASVRFDPSSEGGVGSTATVPVVRPTLALKAIIGGPPWQAVIDGIPGQPPGTMVAPGVRFDRLVIRSVTRDSVVVQAPDTTWILSFKGRL